MKMVILINIQIYKILTRNKGVANIQIMYQFIINEMILLRENLASCPITIVKQLSTPQKILNQYTFTLHNVNQSELFPL